MAFYLKRGMFDFAVKSIVDVLRTRNSNYKGRFGVGNVTESDYSVVVTMPVNPEVLAKGVTDTKVVRFLYSRPGLSTGKVEFENGFDVNSIGKGYDFADTVRNTVINDICCRKLIGALELVKVKGGKKYIISKFSMEIRLEGYDKSVSSKSYGLPDTVANNLISVVDTIHKGCRINNKYCKVLYSWNKSLNISIGGYSSEYDANDGRCLSRADGMPIIPPNVILRLLHALTADGYIITSISYEATGTMVSSDYVNEFGGVYSVSFK